MKAFWKEYREALRTVFKRFFSVRLYVELSEHAKEMFLKILGVFWVCTCVVTFPVSMPVLAIVLVLSDRRDRRKAAEWIAQMNREVWK